MIKQFKCQRCGRCCTELKPAVDGIPGGLLLTPEEIKIFTGAAGIDIHPTVAYTAPWSDDKVIIYYGMIATRCPLYDDDFGCTWYDRRPLVCVRYPLGAAGYLPSTDCPATCDGKCTFNPRYQIAQTLFDERAALIMNSIPCGSILYIYNTESGEWDTKGVKR